MKITQKNEATTDSSVQSVISGLQGLQLDSILGQSAASPAIGITLTELGAALHAAGVHLISEEEENSRIARQRTAREARDARLAAIVAAFEELDAQRDEKTGALSVTCTTQLPQKLKPIESPAYDVKASEVSAGAATPPPIDNAAGPSNIPETITGFVCVACNTHNLLRPAGDRWYAIIKGYSVGVFQDWSLAGPLVSGARNACFRKYPTKAAATEAFQAASRAGLVQVIPRF